MRLLETDAVVLRRKKITANDSYLTLFTRSLGRLEVFARNGNHPKSPLLAGSQPFVYGLFSLSGSSSIQLRGVEVHNNFYRLREDFDQMLMASYLAQILLHLTQERESNQLLFEGLVNCLALLEKFPELRESILVYFYAVCIKQMGIKPQIDSCLVCQSTPASYFDIAQGGSLCAEHHTDSSFEAPELLAILDQAIRLSIKDFLNRKFDEELMLRLQTFQEDYLDFHLESHLREARTHLEDYQ